MKKLIALGAAGLAAVAMVGTAVAADWKPSGPITMMIAFRAGGGADTQARLIAEQLEAKKGWKILPKNVTGKGGSNMAVAMKKAPADGLTIGMVVTETFTYTPQINPKAGYTADDFTYIVTTSGSQMALVSKADKGWKTFDDVIAAGKAGKKLSIAILSPKMGDGTYVIGKKFGIEFNAVRVKGGKGAMNAVVAGDVDLGWMAGIQSKGVKAGDLVNLISMEDERLKISPDAKTLKEYGLPYSFGAVFVLVAPKGIPEDARKAYADAFSEVLSDSNSKATQFINRAFGGPKVMSGETLTAHMADKIKENKALIEASQ